MRISNWSENNDQGFYIGKFVNELENGDYDSFLTRLQALPISITN